MRITYYNPHFDNDLQDLKVSLAKNDIEVILNKVTDEHRIYASATIEIFDIFIYISEHKLELLIGGIGGNIVSNLLWHAISSIWKRIINHKFHYLQSGEIKEREGNILLTIQINKDKEINFKLSSDFKQELIPETLDKFNQIIKSSEIIKNEDALALENNGKKIFRVRFDPEKKIWIAVPLTDNEKRMRDLRKKYEQMNTNDSTDSEINPEL